AGAACCGALDGRLARNAPAAPTVMHEAATTAIVLVLISMKISRVAVEQGPCPRFRAISCELSPVFARHPLFASEDLSPAVVGPAVGVTSRPDRLSMALPEARALGLARRAA